MIINEIGSLCTHRISHYPPILHNCSERPLFECKINFKSSSASYRLVLWKLYLWYEGKKNISMIFIRWLFLKGVVRTTFDIKRFYYYYWVDTSAGELLVPEGIIRPVVSVSVY